MRRRDFLAASVAALVVPRPALAQARYRRLLILVELKGGNDGLNTVVPYADPAYYELRPRLALARDAVLQLDARAGLHPALEPLMPMWRADELAVVQGVGYADPNLSHFRSIEIWDTASASDQYLSSGWLARAFAADPAPPGFAADGVAVGGNDMGPLAGAPRAIVLNDPDQFLRQARLARPEQRSGNAALSHILRVEAEIVQAARRLSGDVPLRTEFPANAFGNALRTAAQLAANRGGVAAVKVSLDGFDTHQDQAARQQRLLAELAAGLAAADVVVPESDSRRGVEPLCAGYGPACGPAIRAALARGDVRAIGFHGAVRVRRLPREAVLQYGDPAVLFFNVNSPDDLARAEALCRSRDS